MTSLTSKHIVERAWELAAESNSVREVREKLKREGYEMVDQHLEGRLLKQQIVQRLLPTDKKRRVR